MIANTSGVLCLISPTNIGNIERGAINEGDKKDGQ